MEQIMQFLADNWEVLLIAILAGDKVVAKSRVNLSKEDHPAKADLIFSSMKAIINKVRN